MARRWPRPMNTRGIHKDSQSRSPAHAADFTCALPMCRDKLAEAPDRIRLARASPRTSTDDLNVFTRESIGNCQRLRSRSWNDWSDALSTKEISLMNDPWKTFSKHLGLEPSKMTIGQNFTIDTREEDTITQKLFGHVQLWSTAENSKRYCKDTDQRSLG